MRIIVVNWTFDRSLFRKNKLSLKYFHFEKIRQCFTVFSKSTISIKHSMHCSSFPMIWAIRSVLCGAMLEKIFKRHPIFCKKRKQKTWKSIWIISEIMEKRRENLIYFSFENNFKIFFSFLNKHSNEKMQSNQEVTSVLFSSSQTQEWRREASEWMIRAFVTLCIFACCLSLGEKLLLDKHENWTFQRFLDIFPFQILFALSLISFPFYLCLRNASSRFFSINKTTSRMQASFRFSSGTFSLSERKS